MTKDYDRIQDPSGKIPLAEPVFLLRGQDVLAPELLKVWAHQLKNRYGESELADMAEKQAEEMVKWQKNHRIRIPTMPLKL